MHKNPAVLAESLKEIQRNGKNLYGNCSALSAQVISLSLSLSLFYLIHLPFTFFDHSQPPHLPLWPVEGVKGEQGVSLGTLI